MSDEDGIILSAEELNRMSKAEIQRHLTTEESYGPTEAAQAAEMIKRRQ